MNFELKGELTLDLTKRVTKCAYQMKDSIIDSEILASLTDEQRKELDRIIDVDLDSAFVGGKIKVFSDE